MSEKDLESASGESPSTPTVEDHLKKIERQLAQLQESMHTMMRLLTTLTPDGSEPKAKEREPVLTEDDQQVFHQIDSLGADANARRVVERIFNKQFAGKPVTKCVVVALKERLKSRKWGIECHSCGEPAAPVWQKWRHSKGERGALVLAHRISGGGFIQHTCRTVFPSIRLIPRPGFSKAK